MKRFFIILFASVYTILSTGLILRVHYCQGEIEAILLAKHEGTSTCCEVNCCQAPAEKKDSDHNNNSSCCDDTVVLIQFVSEQMMNSQKFLESEEELSFLLAITQSFQSDLGVESKNSEDPIVITAGNSPPLWLLYGNLTFYG